MAANNSVGSGIPVLLSWSGSDSKTVVPGTSVSEQKSELRALQLKEREHNLAALRVVVEATIKVTQPASGAAAIAFDKLPKAIASLGVWLPEIGWLYPHDHTPGALHANVNQVIGNGYRRRGIFDVAVPATASTQFTRTIRYELPFALPVLAQELDTAIPMALLEGGRVEVKVAASNAFDGDSTAAVFNEVVLRAWIETTPVQKMWVPGLFGFRQYSSGGNASLFRIEGLGSAPGLSIAEEGCSLGALFVICNPTGIGLGGSTTADQFASLSSQDFDIPDLSYLPLLFDMFDRQLDSDNNTATRWPYSQSETTFGNGQVDGAYLLPIRMPTRGQQLSKLRRINRARDMKVKYGWTGSTPSGEMKHGTLEFYKGKDKLEAMVREAYKIDPRAILAPKTESGKPVSEGALSALRYGGRRMFYSGVAE